MTQWRRTTDTRDWVASPNLLMALSYAVDGHFSGQTSQTVDLLEHAPWVYVIACMRHRLVYIGETYDKGGLIVRLSTQFGPRRNSTLRQRAASVSGVAVLRAPFIIVAARLPVDMANVRVDASSTGVRRLIEALVHERLARFVARRRGWTIVSNTQPTSVSENSHTSDSCDSLVTSFESALQFLENLSDTAPIHLVTLSMLAGVKDTEIDTGELMNKIEVMLFEWLSRELKVKYGAESWWADGVPLSSRKQCAARREEEGATAPVEAYLNLVDLRDVAKNNWDTFGPGMERMSGAQGKDRATQWIVDLNEIRKLWAHPIKQQFRPISNDDRKKVRNVAEKLSAVARGETSRPA